MRPTFQLDTKGFNQVLREVVKQSSREAAVVINGRLFAVVIKAIKYTRRADPAQIEHELGGLGKYTKSGELIPKGSRKKGRLRVKEDSFASRIVNARRRDYAGADFMLWGSALEDAARKLISARKSSTAFIASGWIWAVRALLPFIKFRSGTIFNSKGIRTTGVPKGYAIAARPGAHVSAIAVNTALIASGGKFQAPGAHNPLPIAVDGLQKAFADEKAEMEKHLREKFIKALRKAGADARP